MDDLGPFIASARTGGWELERDMRRSPVHLFSRSRDPRAMRLRTLRTALALQNDGDEILSAAAAAHIRACEPRTPPPWYAPCTGYKLSVEWVQHTWDREALGQVWVQAGLLPSPQLASHLMAPGPVVHSLAQVVRSGRLERWHLSAAAPQLGPGAAVHLSGASEPVGVWLKAGGTIESLGTFGVVDPGVLAAARSRTLTAR